MQRRNLLKVPVIGAFTLLTRLLTCQISCEVPDHERPQPLPYKNRK